MSIFGVVFRYITLSFGIILIAYAVHNDTPGFTFYPTVVVSAIASILLVVYCILTERD